jgi:hypothetical protein
LLCSGGHRAELGRLGLGGGFDRELGQAEVEHLHAAPRREHHVVRLQVAVDDPGGMRRGDGVGQSDRDVE